MNPRTKYLLAALGATIVSRAMFTTEAQSPGVYLREQLGPGFYRSIPYDVTELWLELELETRVLEKLVKPYKTRLIDSSGEGLSVEEAEALLAEVDRASGDQSMKVRDLRDEFRTRMTELRDAHLARKRRSLARH